MAQELKEQPRHDPGTFPECHVREVQRGGRTRVVLDDPRIVFVPRSVIDELATERGATVDFRAGQVIYSHMHADGMDELADRISKFPYFEINRDRAQYCKDELYQANFPYVTKPRFSNFDTGNNNVRIYMAPNEERYLAGEDIAFKATRITQEEQEELLGQVAAGKLTDAKIQQLTSRSLEDLQEYPERIEPYHLAQLRAQYETAGPRTLNDIREMIKDGRITPNNAGRPIDDASLKAMTSAEAYELIKTHKPLCTTETRNQILALVNMGMIRPRELGGPIDMLTKRDAENLRKKTLPYLLPEEQEQFNKLASNQIEAAGRGSKYNDDPTTIEDHRHNSKLMIAKYVSENCADKKEVALGKGATIAQVLASTPFHAVVAPNGDPFSYTVIDFREHGVKKASNVADAIREREWSSSPKRRGEVPECAETQLDGHFLLVVPDRRNGSIDLSKSLTDTRDGAKCELEALEQARQIGNADTLREAKPGERGSVVAKRGLYTGISNENGVAVVLSEALDNPNATFLEEVGLKDNEADGQTESVTAEKKRGRAHAGASR